MGIFIRNCNKLSIFWIAAFVTILSVYLANSLGKKNTGLTVLYWLLIITTIIVDFSWTYDTFKKSFREKDDLERFKLKGFVKTLRVLLIFNLIITVAIVCMFGTNSNNSKELGYIFASVCVFSLFFMVKGLFIIGTFKLGKIIRTWNLQIKHVGTPKSEETLPILNN